MTRARFDESAVAWLGVKKIFALRCEWRVFSKNQFEVARSFLLAFVFGIDLGAETAFLFLGD